METNLISLISYNIFCFMIIIDIIYNMNFLLENRQCPKLFSHNFFFRQYLIYFIHFHYTLATYLLILQ